MLSSRTLVLDANILIRAILGEKVKNLIMANHQKINFFTPDICIADAKKYLPILLKKEIFLMSQQISHLPSLQR